MPLLDTSLCQPALKRFALAYLAGVLLVVGVSVALEILAGIELPSSGTSFVSTLVGVHATATVFVQQGYKTLTAPPTTGPRLHTAFSSQTA